MFPLSTLSPARLPSALALALVLALVCVLALAAPIAAGAADHAAGHDEPKAAAGHGTAPKAAAKADSRSDAKTAGRAEPTMESAAPARTAPRAAAGAARDPMDVLRERLAEKLGATRAPDAPNPNVLRVVSRPSAAPTASARVAAGQGGEAVPAAVAARSRAANRPAVLAAINRELSGNPHGTAVAAAAPHAAHWDYQGAGGPDAWGAMKPEFSKCSSGTRQSPIDIRDGVKVQLDEVQFDYRPSGFRVIDNGHTVQVNVAAGNSIEVLGRRYDLLQFHFHRPSEERINGRQFEMVAHLVHKDLEGRLAVVAVLLDRGAAQPVIQSVWNNLPLEKGEEVAAQTPLDLNALLPVDRSYYTYMGSLTTPPCSEGVLWMVLKNPVPVSSQQVSIFSRLYPMNARPIQSASGRLIKESN